MAGLIPQSFIDDLLNRADIVEVIDKRVKLKKTGKNYSACCPFHQEKTPSFSVEPDKQFYYCFGCGAAGNALGFVMNYDQTEFPDAVASLAADYGLTVPREEKSTHSQKKRQEHEELLSALEQASLFYQQQLRVHPARDSAVNYLKGRGLTGQIAKRFGIGFSPPGWSNLLTHLQQYKISKTVQEQAGLVIPKESNRSHHDDDTHYDRFRDRIMFPIRDSRGRVIAFGGRVLGDEKPKYLNSPETPVFHKGSELYGLWEARKSRQKIDSFLIVEGYMDVVALAQHGIDFAVATLGTATSATHLTRLFRLVKNVVFSFDGDNAGRAAAARALTAALPLMEDGRQVRFLFLPEGEDPDTLVRKEGADAFRVRLVNAKPLSDVFFDQLGDARDFATMDGKARLFSQAIPLIKLMPRGLFQQLMLDKLATLAGTRRATIDQLLQEAPAPAPVVTQPDDEPPPWLEEANGAHHPAPAARPKRDFRNPEPAQIAARMKKSAGLLAVELLLHQPSLAQKAPDGLAALTILGDEDTNLLLELLEVARDDPDTSTYALLGHCYGTPAGKRLTQLLKNERITPEAGRAEEFSFVLGQLLQEAQKQQKRKQLLEQLKPRVRSAKNDTPDS
ncbi:DNA primase [Gammaproteobacteria bacterium LSUCC0112]|nr:DNA primase [Gammaproteobacteria bacterium LSUCC0112]